MGLVQKFNNSWKMEREREIESRLWQSESQQQTQLTPHGSDKVISVNGLLMEM